jgi:uncharacterized membrane protein required for colicin V production
LLGIFCGFLATYILVDRKWHFGYNVYTVTKQENKMTHELTLKLTADQINRLVDALLDSLPAEPENRVILAEVQRSIDSNFAQLMQQ